MCHDVAAAAALLAVVAVLLCVSAFAPRAADEVADDASAGITGYCPTARTCSGLRSG